MTARPGPSTVAPLTCVASAGVPLPLRSASGAKMTVVIDATDPASFLSLWGMSLLERNLRLVERFGARQIHVLAAPAACGRASNRRFPATDGCAPVVHAVAGGTFSSITEIARSAVGPVLLLDGRGLYDRRVVGALWQAPAPAGATVGGQPVAATAVLIDASTADFLAGQGTSLSELRDCVHAQPAVHLVDVESLDSHLVGLRKSVSPEVLMVRDEADIARADTALKALSAKGVNDLLAEFIHPPIEFFLTRLVAMTPVTPNQVSGFNALLNVISIPLLALGEIWAAVLVNLVRGVMDGVDGKLARLTLRESQGGDHLDHMVDRAYLPLVFLALGWHLSGGNWRATPFLVAAALGVGYGLNRLLATSFSRLTGVSSGELRPVDRVVRRIWPKRNICMLALIVSLLFSRPDLGLFAIAGLTGFMLIFRSVRLCQEWRLERRRRVPA